MAGPQHRTPEYRQAERRLRNQIARRGAECVEPNCLMPTRDIPAGAPRTTWHVCHDPSGTIITGPGHARCNTSEGATRGNQQRAGHQPRRWIF